jgi:leader peptidase (prepilin peptidase) / N-methyltransferase
VKDAPQPPGAAIGLIGAAGALAFGASLWAAPGFAGLAGAALAGIALAIAFVDWRFLIVPNELTGLALALGLVDLSHRNWSAMPAPALEALIRCAAMAGVFLAFLLCYRRLRGREGMGMGDVKLAGVAGAWLDWTSLPIAVEIAALSALGFVLARQAMSRQPLDPLAKLPFGAFLAPAIWSAWLLERWWN